MPILTIIEKDSYSSRWEQIQRFTNRHYAKSERLDYSALNRISPSLPSGFKEP